MYKEGFGVLYGGKTVIIDMHAHGMAPWLSYEKCEKLILENMEKYDIDKVYVSNLYSQIPNKEEVKIANDRAYLFKKNNPEKIEGYVYISPEHDNAEYVLQRGIEEQGFIGVKLWVSTFCNDVCVYPIMERVIEYGVPVLIHSFHKSKGQLAFETVGKHVEDLAKRYPELKIIMAHYGGNCYNGIPMIRECSNVWVDLSCSISNGDTLDYTVENIGSDRILFGSDMPGDYITNVGKVLEANLSEEDREKIFYKNTLKVFDKNFRLGASE